MSRTRVDRTLLAVALAGIAALLVWRIVGHGVLPMAPDDAEYIGVGRRLLAFRTPTRVNGELYTIRSWVWPLMTGTASRFVPGDVFRGPKLLGVTLGLVALIAAVGFAYRRRGGLAAVGTAAALGLTAAVWEVAGSTRVDVGLIAFLTVTILVAAEPSPGRVVVAGALAGLTLLVKESSALLVLLPLAWMRFAHLRAWWRAALRFWAAFALVVSWWFLYVLVARGEIFPFQGLSQAVNLQVPRAWAPNGAAWTLVAGWGLALLIVAIGARRDVGRRVLLIATAALLPAAAIAWTKELALRQFVPLAVLGAIAVGVALADVVEWAVARRPAARAWVVSAVAVVVAAVALGPIVHVQRDSVYAEAPLLDLGAADWIRQHTTPGSPILSSFRFEALTWARIGDRNDFRLLDLTSSVPAPVVSDQVWLDWSDGSFHSLERRALRADLDGSGTLMLTGRHRLGPMALALWLRENGTRVGLPPLARLGTIGTSGWVDLYGVDDPQPKRIPTIVTASAVDHLYDDELRSAGPFLLAGTPEAMDIAQVRLGTLGITPVGRIETPAR